MAESATKDIYEKVYAKDVVYDGETSTSQLKRSIEDIAAWLTRELAFPEGVIVLTGTCLVPPDEFTLRTGDGVRIQRPLATRSTCSK